MIRRLDYSCIKISKRWCGPRSECHWRPKTIAIIQDEKTGLVFTGASKAIAAGITPLEKKAYDITVKRLGTEFREKIDKCNFDLRSCLNTYDSETEKPPPWFRKFQEPFSITTIRKNLPEIPIFEASTNTDTDTSRAVACFALDTQDLKVKSPCTRCQCFYHTWTLFDGGWKPNMADKWKHFQREKPWNQFIRQDYGFNYCAETVAAAQLAAFYTGNVISDVQE